MSKQEQPGSEHWYSAVEAPEVLGDVDAGRWDESADFVVVGYGGAGVAAAIEAAERGLSVIALDRYEGGGSTALNGGIYYAGGGTAIQKQAGVEDSVEAMFQYLRGETQGVVSDATLRDFCEGSAASLDWLIERGVRFDATVYAKKTSYPPPGYHLYHSDSSLCAARAAVAKPAPRGHKVYSPSTAKAATGFGTALTDPLRAAAEKLGVRLHRHSEVRKLITDASGRVVGVSLWQIPASSPAYAEYARLQALANKYLLLLPPAFPGAGITMALSRRYAAKAAKLEARHRVERRIRARKGVCLSAGGFVFNRQMVDHHAPKYSAGMPLGNPGDDGSGIRLGQSVGGATERMQHMSAWRFVSPPSGMSWGMMVDGRGKRFSDETAYGAAIGYEIIEHCEGRAWIVFDARLYAEIQKQLKSDDLYPFQSGPAKLALMFARKKAPTLEALAAQCGLDAATLKAEVAAYNLAAEGQAADTYGKSAKDAWALQQGPYYALDISIHSRLFPLPTLSLGGLVVDERSGAVQRADGSAIPGLYAAGRNAVGICSHLYVSGLSAADCIYSGRRAAVAASSL
ncbi:FAD-binding protein [Stagnimonas aquatica]|uniref:FAD-binding protein n=1 Tax=Stagnimonas aquatica TaxID=2689987 RepID=A0A3N0VH61_9GAMM|nr:FAD-binding protein [Stagnimonas aquatica]ROH92099.1 FAD-binding protein [Stagnimonas aquatica]